MTKFKKVLSGFIGLYIFATLSMAYAQGVPGIDGASPKEHPGQRVREIYSQLGLTDAQKAQLEANKQQSRVEMERARKEMKTNREALQQELMKPQLDLFKINEIHGRIKALQSQMEDNRLNSILAVRNILTPEQFLKFVSLMHKHKQEHKE